MFCMGLAVCSSCEEEAPRVSRSRLPLSRCGVLLWRAAVASLLAPQLVLQVPWHVATGSAGRLQISTVALSYSGISVNPLTEAGNYIKIILNFLILKNIQYYFEFHVF